MRNGKWRWRIASLAVAAATAGTLGLLSAGPAGASTGSCLDTWGAGTTPGVPSGCGTEQEYPPAPGGALSFDVYQQRAAAWTPVNAWPNTTSDPATDFFAYTIGGQTEYEYAPAGRATNLCVTVSGANYGLALRPCGWWTWQRFWHYNPYAPEPYTATTMWGLASVAVRGDVVHQTTPKGAQFTLTYDPLAQVNSVFIYGNGH